MQRRARELRAMYQEKPSNASAPQHAGQHRADPDVAEACLRVRDEVEHQPDAEDQQDASRRSGTSASAAPAASGTARASRRTSDASATWMALTSSRPTTITQRRPPPASGTTPSVLQEAALLLDAPRFVDRAGDRAEDAERRPDQRQAAGDADLDAGLPERVELRGDEIELRREIAEDEVRTASAIVFVGGDRAEQRDDQQQKRKQREQRVVRDRGGVRQVVAVDELDEAAPRGEPEKRSSARRRRSDEPASRGALWHDGSADSGTQAKCPEASDGPESRESGALSPSERRRYERPKSLPRDRCCRRCEPAADDAAAAAGAVAAAGGAAGIAARFVGAARRPLRAPCPRTRGRARPRSPAASRRLLVLLRRASLPDVARLFAERAAQFRARLRRQQHAEAGAEHGAGQQAHHEPAAAAAFVVIPIVAVRHCVAPPCGCSTLSVRCVPRSDDAGRGERTRRPPRVRCARA